MLRRPAEPTEARMSPVCLVGHHDRHRHLRRRAAMPASRRAFPAPAAACRSMVSESLAPSDRRRTASSREMRGEHREVAARGGDRLALGGHRLLPRSSARRSPCGRAPYRAPSLAAFGLRSGRRASGDCGSATSSALRPWSAAWAPCRNRRARPRARLRYCRHRARASGRGRGSASLLSSLLEPVGMHHLAELGVEAAGRLASRAAAPPAWSASSRPRRSCRRPRRTAARRAPCRPVDAVVLVKALILVGDQHVDEAPVDLARASPAGASGRHRW